MTLAAVLWDMDGLLVDTEPMWTVAEVELAATLGGTWTDEIKAAVVGTRLDVSVPTILRWYDVEPTPARVTETSAWLLHRVAELFSGARPAREAVPQGGGAEWSCRGWQESCRRLVEPWQRR